jgi:hypothetical protein
MGKCKFNDLWLSKILYSSWLLKVHGDPFSARCGVCMKTFSIASMGESALTSHSKAAGHVKAMKSQSQGEK